MRSLWERKVVGSNPTIETKLGSVAERLKALVLKTRVRQRTVGSNPTASAIFACKYNMLHNYGKEKIKKVRQSVDYGVFFIHTL